MTSPCAFRSCRVGAAAAIIGLVSVGVSNEAFAQSADVSACVATETMRGGRNNYVPNAPLVDNLGKGFVVSGTVRKAGSCEPLPNVRVQIWASTERGGEREASNRGSVITDSEGHYRLEMSQIVPNFGQPHGHLAYDDPGYGPVFLRPVMGSKSDTSLSADFILAPDVADDPAGT